MRHSAAAMLLGRLLNNILSPSLRHSSAPKSRRQSRGIAIVKYFFYPHVDITLIYFVLTGNLDYYFRLTAHLVLPRVSPAGWWGTPGEGSPLKNLLEVFHPSCALFPLEFRPLRRAKRGFAPLPHRLLKKAGENFNIQYVTLSLPGDGVNISV